MISTDYIFGKKSKQSDKYEHIQDVVNYADTNNIAKPSEPQLTLLDAFIGNLKTEGIFGKLDFFHLLAHDAGEPEFGLINYINPQKHAILTSITPGYNLEYSPNLGTWEAAGTSMEIDYIPNRDTFNFSLNDCSFGYRYEGDGTGALSTLPEASIGCTGTNFGAFSGRVYINNQSKMNFGAPVRPGFAGLPEDFILIQKRETTINEFFNNGILLNTFSQAPQSLSDNYFDITSFVPAQLFFGGASFTPEEITAFHQLTDNYLTTIRS